jgi:hypothetical protein
MKSKIIIKVLSLSYLILILGCTEILDVKPVSTITGAGYWNSPEDAHTYLVGIYNRLRNLSNTTYYGEDRSDLYIEGDIGPVSAAWAHSLRADNGPNWASMYNFIFHVNSLIKETANMDFSDQNQKNHILAQGYTLRALIYFRMAKIWGDVPIVLEPAENANVDLKARAPVNQVFDQINEDISQALSLFPTNAFTDKNFISKPATYALLADVKIWTGKVLNGGASDFNEALSAISQVESSGVSLLPNYADIFDSEKKKNAEIIFSIFFEKDEHGNQYGDRLTTWGISIDGAENKDEIAYTDRNSARAVYAPSPELVNSFDPVNDVRRGRAIVAATQNNGQDTVLICFNKFRGTVYPDDRYFDDDIIEYRLADMILLKAEALAATNKITEAITELNKTRNRAGIGDYSGPKDKISVEKEILEERKRELFNELKRWNDLVRFHNGGTINIYEVVPNLNGKNGYPLYFPVSQSVLDNNSLIEQTEGY